MRRFTLTINGGITARFRTLEQARAAVPENILTDRPEISSYRIDGPDGNWVLWFRGGRGTQGVSQLGLPLRPGMERL